MKNKVTGDTAIDVLEVQLNWPTHFMFGGDTKSLIDVVKRSGNSAYLGETLRGPGELSPALRNFVADILEGTIKARPKRKRPVDYVDPFQLKALVKQFQKGLTANDSCRKFGAKVLKRLKYSNPSPETKREIHAAAEFLARDSLKITPSQFNALMFPRRRSKTYDLKKKA